jgi:hypothetical protein
MYIVKMNIRKHTGLAELKAGHAVFIPSGPSMTISNASTKNPVNCAAKCYLL